MREQNYITTIFMFLLLVSSCSKEKLSDSLPVHALIGEGNTELTDKTIFKNIKNISLETTEESLLGDNFRIISVDNEFIVLTERATVYFFDSNSGKYISSIARKGNGPEEYNTISDAIVDFKNEEIHIYDGNTNKIQLYSFNGGYKKTIMNDSIGTVNAFDDETFITYNSPTQTHTYNYALYDKQWNYIKGLNKRSEKENVITKNPSLVKYLSCFIFNNKSYTYKDNTLFEINESGFVPFLFIDKRGYAIPSEIMNDLSKKDKRANYIWGDFGRLAKNYFFFQYYYDYKKYKDIWDLSSKKLIFRNIASTRADKDGMSIDYNNNTLHVWPKHVQNNILYCILPSEDISENEENPSILRIELD